MGEKDILDDKSRPVKKVPLIMSRRRVFKLAGATLVGLTVACDPSTTSSTVTEPATATPSSPILPIPSVENAGQIALAERRENVPKVEIDVIVEYDRRKQDVGWETNNRGEKKAISCDPPKPVKEQRGFIYDQTEFDWSHLRLPEIIVDKKTLPVLTSQTLTAGQIKFLEAWYANPGLLEKLIKQKGQSDTQPAPIDTLIVDFRSTHNRYYEMDDFGCHFIDDSNGEYDPEVLYRSATTAIREDTNGQVNYRAVAIERITENEMPLTNDPSLTDPGLIEAYKRTINYKRLGELAVENGVSTVFTFAGPSGGMYESRVWTDAKTEKRILIFGMNYNAPPEDAVHSWTHYFEDRMKNSSLADIYLLCVGRDQEYSLPYQQPKSVVDRNILALKDRSYAAVGIGTVHLTPNSVDQYQYGCPIPVMLPGSGVVNKDTWGGKASTYYSWWLKQMPPAFFSVIDDKY